MTFFSFISSITFFWLQSLLFQLFFFSIFGLGTRKKDVRKVVFQMVISEYWNGNIFENQDDTF